MGQRGIVITGSTRGLGYALAKEFLRLGCSVMVSGRSAAAVDGALTSLKEAIPNASVFGFPCDVRSSLEVDALWTEAAKQLGRIDHWINNAGIGQPTKRIWELDPDTVDDVIGTDLSGILNGARTAMRGMIAQKGGAIWFMEGHGSDGRILSGLSVYGAAKRALRYVAEALAVEARGTDVVVGALSPGIMITDFTMSQIERAEPQQREQTVKIFNILGDRPERVAAFLAPRVLSARRSGIRIAWLTNAKILYRFMSAGLTRRRVIDD